MPFPSALFGSSCEKKSFPSFIHPENVSSVKGRGKRNAHACSNFSGRTFRLGGEKRKGPFLTSFFFEAEVEKRADSLLLLTLPLLRREESRMLLYPWPSELLSPR